MIPVRFRCLKCGYCCSHIISETRFGKLGIFLMPKEAEWFPKDKISPLYAAGLKGRSRPRPREIFAYQLNVPFCPWLERTLQTCIMWHHRPLVCRSYPIRESSIHKPCRFVTANLSGEEIQLDTKSLEEEVAADESILSYVKRFRGEPLWVWPLDKATWTRTWTRMKPVESSALQLHAHAQIVGSPTRRQFRDQKVLIA